MTHLETVQQIYAAFGRGDVAAILELLADDVDWEYGIAPNDVPWLLRRRRRSEVADFFAALQGVDFETFEPKTLLEQGNVVVALVDVALTVRATGRRIAEEDETHIWRFDAEGRVKRFTHKVDSHAHWLAFHGDAVPAA